MNFAAIIVEESTPGKGVGENGRKRENGYVRERGREEDRTSDMIMSGHETNGKNNKGKDRTGEENVGVDVGEVNNNQPDGKITDWEIINETVSNSHAGQPYPSLDSRTVARFLTRCPFGRPRRGLAGGIPVRRILFRA